MTEVIEKIRIAGENEFFFRHHSNIGMCEEFDRLIKYINQHSNISIERVKYKSIDQIQEAYNSSGGALNFKITRKKEIPTKENDLKDELIQGLADDVVELSKRTI